MATFEITAPDGHTYQVDAPDGASHADVLQYVQSQHAQQPQRSTAPAYDPTEGMSGLDKFAAGVGKSVVDTGRRMQQLGSYVGIGDGDAIQRQIDEAKRLDAPLMNTGAGAAGDITGEIGMSLVPGAAALRAGRAIGAIPGLARAGEALASAGQVMQAPKTIGQAAAVGAGLGAMQPVGSDESTARNMAFGAAGGMAGNALPRALGRVVSPQTSPDVRTLIAAGVTPTPGQILGGAAQRIEDGLTSVPILGDAIKSAQSRANNQFNVAAYNRALGPIGEAAPAVPGSEAIAHVSETLSKAYNDLLPKLTIQADGQFGQDLSTLRQIGAQLPDNYQKRFDAVLQRHVLNTFDDGGGMSGRQMKDVDSTLGALSRSYTKSPDPDQRMFGQAVQQTQAALRDLTHRSNPEYGDHLDDINTGWANLVRIQQAAASTGAKDGVFSPAQLRSAVRSSDSSLRKGDFAKGRALLQDLANAGSNVLSSKVPDSGTPFRAMNALAAGGAYAIDPTILGAGLTASAMYTKPMQKLAATLLTKRPQGFGLLGDGLANASQLTALPGAGLGLLYAK